MREINLLWMYPDILNLHGDRGNIMALMQIAESLQVKLNVTKSNSAEGAGDFNDFDMVYFGAGQLRNMQTVAEDLKTRADNISSFVESGKYVLVLGTTGCVFGKEISFSGGEKCQGLGILNMNAKELERTEMPMLTKEVYGDDIYCVCDDSTEIIGCQIQRMDFTLEQGQKPFAKVIYGYGNNCKDGTEGAVCNNLIFTNTMGPLMSCNPWLGRKIFEDILQKKGESVENSPVDSPLSVSYMDYAVESLKLKKQFIKEKKKLPGIIYKEF